MDNSKSIIRLYFAKMKPAFAELPNEEKMAFMQADRANLDQLGMKAISMIDCTGMDDEWDYIGVEEWPSMEAIKQREQFETEVLQLQRYVEYKTILGKPQSFTDYGKE